jgi:putative hydrolase of the HAD superfamily
MKYFLFDIGNVLTDFTFSELLRVYADHSGRPQGPQTDLDEEMYVLAEKGLLSEPDYVAYLNQEKGLDWTVDTLHEVWQGLFSINPVGRALFDRAAQSDAGVYTLSNCVDYHVRAVEKNWSGFFDAADGMFVSYRLGVRKPDPNIYTLVLKELGAEPGQCFFIDDLQENVDAARSVGIQAHRFISENHSMVERAAAEFFGWN